MNRPLLLLTFCALLVGGSVSAADEDAVKDGCGAAHWVSVAAPFTGPVVPPKIAAGRWHTCEVVVKGDTCTAKFDGLACVDLKLDPKALTPFNFVPALKREKGKVGFQVNTGLIKFRNIEILDQSKDR